MPAIKNKLIFIVGPTAVGKSSIAFYLAKKINAEIISADSMQVYRKLPILTNYPAPRMLEKVQHHLISVIDLKEEYNVVKFITQAKKNIKQIIKRKKIPIICGGSGLYINSLVDGIFSGPSADKNLRKDLETQALRFGKEYVYKQLQSLDPQSAKQIHPNNLQRVIRAIEVCIKTRGKMSELKKERYGLTKDFDVRLIGLIRSRPQIYELVDKRVDEMFRQGVVKEVRKIYKKPMSATAKKIIGINEIIGFLKNEQSLQEAQRLIKRNTRHFAKRQISWFKRDSRIYWVDVEKNTTEEIIREICQVTET
jgi:tRNA dimethylallyltransferase